MFDRFTITTGGIAAETVLLTDDFGAASLDTAKWSIDVQSGSQDASIPVAQGSSRLTIGPLLQGTANSHYNGILSAQTFDLTGTSVTVEAVTAPSSATTADMMLTVTRDGQHHYRIFVEAGLLRFERRTAYGALPSVGRPASWSHLVLHVSHHRIGAQRR